MYLIDTNIHVSFLLRNFENDDLTRQYLALYESIKLRERVVPDYILGELETFIMQVVPSRYQLPAEDMKKIKHLTQEYFRRLTQECTIVVPDVQTVERARDIYFENATTNYISFFDSLCLATAEQNGYTIFTRDKRMNSLAKRMQIASFEPHIST